MSPLIRDEFNKWKIDWNGLIILLITAIATFTGSYFALKQMTEQNAYRLSVIEEWKKIAEVQVHEMYAKHLVGEVNHQYLNGCITEMKQDIKEVKEMAQEMRMELRGHVKSVNGNKKSKSKTNPNYGE